MSPLDHFNGEQKNLLASLPYRVGAWMSMSDSVGKQASELHEKHALDHYLFSCSKSPSGSAFVQAVILETCARKAEWASWRKDLGVVPDECTRAMAVLAGRIDQADIDAFKDQLMLVATHVAKAYREFDRNESIPVRLWSFFKLRLDALIGLLRGEAYESEALLNISLDEDMALAALARALHGEMHDVHGEIAADKA